MQFPVVSNAIAGNASVPPTGPFHYIQVDDSREPPKPFGLGMGDLTGDGLPDIVAGKYMYRNPGADLSGKWVRTELPGEPHIDAMLIVNVDDDAYVDVIGEWLPNIYWLEALDASGEAWTIRARIGEIPLGPHGNAAQGYGVAQVVAGGKPEILLSSKGVFYFEIPDNPDNGDWPRTRVVESTNSEEGIGVGDIDGDGDLDLTGCIDKDLMPNPVGWYENPGNGTGDWTYHRVGELAYVADRHYAADINSDGRLDMVISTANGKADGVYWFEAPEDPKKGEWIQHAIARQTYCNSMDVTDMNNDGIPDIVVGQHRDLRQLSIFLNDGTGCFIHQPVDVGKESHLGSRVFDMDGDGDQDIVSIGYDTYQYLHLWRNDAVQTHHSTITR